MLVSELPGRNGYLILPGYPSTYNPIPAFFHLTILFRHISRKSFSFPSLSFVTDLIFKMRLTSFSLFGFSVATLSSQFNKNTDSAVGATVRTTSGHIVGHAAYRPGYQKVSEYLGIRYGQPAVGPLRFAAPVAYRDNGTHEASKYVCVPLNKMKDNFTN
jgi:hypothetical protein